MGSLSALLEQDAELERRQAQLVEAADAALRAQESRLDAVLGRGAGAPSAAGALAKGAAAAGAAAVSVPAVARRSSSAQGGASLHASGVRPASVSSSGLEGGTTSNNQQGDADAPLSPSDARGAELGSDAVVRLQRAKLKQLSEENAALLERSKSVSEQNASLKKKAAALGEEASKADKRCVALEQAKDKLKVEADKLRERLSEVEAQLASASRELRESGRAAKEAETEGTSKDVRLHRALDEVDKLKARLRKAEEEQRAGGDAGDAELKRLRADNKRLERQKQELLAAFRKQLKLIDVLKRQKIHLEAAKMLSFTEDEFTRTLESHTHP
jgi:hypothetical protein